MSLHKEISFELEICQHLAAHGWLYAEGDAAGYDRARALFPADLLAWVQATQPKAWDTLAKNHGSKAADTLLDRVRTQLDQRGTLDVLRHGVELLGLKTPPSLAQFKPALAINPDIPPPTALTRHCSVATSMAPVWYCLRINSESPCQRVALSFPQPVSQCASVRAELCCPSDAA